MANPETESPNLSGDNLDSRLLSAVRNLSFLPHLLSSDSYSGIHDGKKSGSNMEFSSHRQYEPGDDLRYLDWNVLAKTGETHLKQFESENRINANIIADASKSMDYTSESLTKWELARALAVMCAGILLQQQDRVKLIADGQSTIQLPDWTSPAQLSASLEEIKQITPGGETSLLATAREYENTSKNKKLWIFISDFWLPDLDGFFQWLKTIQNRGHQALLIDTRDSRERNFTTDGPCRLEDMESGETITLTGEESQKLSDELQKFQKRLKNLSLRNNITFWSFYTDYNPIKQLHSHLANSQLNQ
ncbi:MAG: DUF58 domain-containing protein [bacterium]